MHASQNKIPAKPTFLQRCVEHPASVDETYWQHARFALGFSGSLFLAAGAALVHAFVPAAFEATAGRIVRTLHSRIAARH